MFLIPSALIVLIWSAIAHHFITQPRSMPRWVNFYKILSNCPFFSAHSNIMKWVTIKLVGITLLFLVTIGPFCVAFARTSVITPTNTVELDTAFPLYLMNGPLQPVIYILAFSNLRKAFLQMIGLARSDVLQAAADAPVLAVAVAMH